MPKKVSLVPFLLLLLSHSIAAETPGTEGGAVSKEEPPSSSAAGGFSISQWATLPSGTELSPGIVTLDVNMDHRADLAAIDIGRKKILVARAETSGRFVVEAWAELPARGPWIGPFPARLVAGQKSGLLLIEQRHKRLWSAAKAEEGRFLLQAHSFLPKDIDASRYLVLDIDGDGRDDFLVANKKTNELWCASGGAFVFQRCGQVPAVADWEIVAGDVNGDGRDDILAWGKRDK